MKFLINESLYVLGVFLYKYLPSLLVSQSITDYPTNMIYTAEDIPKLICIRKGNLEGMTLNQWMKEKDHIYIGNTWKINKYAKDFEDNYPNTWFEFGLDWQHYKGKLTTEEYFKKYEELGRKKPLEELAGKTMGCWCDGDMTKCHGQVLKKLFEEVVINKKKM